MSLFDSPDFDPATAVYYRTSPTRLVVGGPDTPVPEGATVVSRSDAKTELLRLTGVDVDREHTVIRLDSSGNPEPSEGATDPTDDGGDLFPDDVA